MSENRETCCPKEEGKVFVSQEQDVFLDEIAKYKSLGHRLLEKLTNEWPDKILFVDDASGRTWTGLQVKERILNIAAALIDKYNFQYQSFVCIAYDHCDYTVLLALAIICAGGAVACAYPKDPYAELLYLAKKVEPKYLFCHHKNRQWGQQLSQSLGYEVITISMDFDLGNEVESFEKLFNYDHNSSPSTLQMLPIECKDIERDIVFITMSSGTTGKPKAVPSTHWNCLTDLGSRFSSRRYQFEIVFANTASLDYVSGRLIVLGAIESGYKAIIINGFEPDTYCKAIEKHRVNILYLGAASFFTFITYPRLGEFDISSAMVVFPMGAKITYLNELRTFFANHPNIKAVRQGYGTSELSGCAMNSMSPEEYLRDSENCGQLLPFVECKIIDPNSGNQLGINQQGLLSVRGPRKFPGYYDKSRNKTEPFVRDHDTFDEDGFYKTGDLAYFNEKEQLYVLGRLKELMHCRGSKKVLPQELEELIGQHKIVNKVCVLGVENQRERTLHCPRAFIVPKSNWRDYFVSSELEKCLNLNESPGAKAAEEEEVLTRKGQHKLCSNLTVQERHRLEEHLMKFVNNNIGWEKQLTGGIVILDDFGTRGATGKVDKNYLRSLTTDEIEIFGDRSC